VNVGRVHLRNVDYAVQQRIIEALDDYFQFEAIGIDNGHSGCAVAHNLMALSPNWAQRVVPVSFGGTVSWDSYDAPVIKRHVKELATEFIIRLIASGEVVFPPIADRFNQYAGHTYHIAPSGRMVYAKGNDHI